MHKTASWISEILIRNQLALIKDELLCHWHSGYFYMLIYFSYYLHMLFHFSYYFYMLIYCGNYFYMLTYFG